MYKSSNQLYNEFFKDTAAYRSEYLRILIKKYVKPKEKNVDVQVDMRSFQIIKVSNNLKTMRKKSFGSLSSYYCESGFKTTSYWKKKIVSRKRASSRKYVDINSSDEEFNCAKSKRKLKYHSETDYESCSSDEESEITFSHESDPSYEDHSSLSALENESIISCEDTSSFSLDTTMIASERRQNISTENETSEFLRPNDKKYSLQANNAELLSNSQMTALKLNHPKQVQVLIKNFSSLSNSKCDEIVYDKLGLCFNGSISPTKSKKKSERSVHPALSVCNLNSFAHYVSGICATPPKFRFSDIGSGISSKIHQISSVSNDKSLQSTVPKIKANDTREERSKIYSKDLGVFNGKSLAYVSNKTTLSSKFRFSDVGSGISSKIHEVSSFRNDKSGISSKIHQVSSVSNDKSLQSTVAKIKANDTREERSKIYSQDLSIFNGKSLACASSKPTQPSKFKFNKAKMEKPKDYYQAAVCNSKSLLCVPSKTRFNETALENPKDNHKTRSTSLLSPSRYCTRNSAKIDIFMNKKVSDDKKTHEKESLLLQSTIPFRKSKSKGTFKKCYEYLGEDCVPIDDLSLKSFHSKKEKKITRQKNN